MEFSLFFFGSLADDQRAEGAYQWILQTVKLADDNAFKAVWTPERHFDPFGGLFPNPSILAAAIAVSTNHIQIRSGSLVAPLHHTVRIAEDWAVIDNLSGGRAAISFASGWQANDFIFFPERYKGRHKGMFQQIADVKRLWKGESLAFENGTGATTNIQIFPKPVQQTLPVWVTVSGKTETFIDAGKIGANILTHLLWQDPSELIEKINAYRNALLENGFDPQAGKVSVMAHTFLHENDQDAKKIVTRPLKEYIRSSVNLIERMIMDSPEALRTSIGRYGNVTEKIPENLLDELLDFACERFFENSALMGSASKCARFVETLSSYGVDEIACLIDFGVDRKRVDASLSRLSTFKDQYKSSTRTPARPVPGNEKQVNGARAHAHVFVQTLKEKIDEQF